MYFAMYTLTIHIDNTQYDENLTIEENVENVLSSIAEDCENEVDCHGSNVYQLIDTI